MPVLYELPSLLSRKMWPRVVTTEGDIINSNMAELRRGTMRWDWDLC